MTAAPSEAIERSLLRWSPNVWGCWRLPLHSLSLSSSKCPQQIGDVSQLSLYPIFCDYRQIISKNLSHAMPGLILSFLVPGTVLLNMTVQKQWVDLRFRRWVGGPRWTFWHFQGSQDSVSEPCWRQEVWPVFGALDRPSPHCLDLLVFFTVATGRLLWASCRFPSLSSPDTT